MFNSVSFVEMLEGRRSAVETTLQRIQRDKRHSGVQILSFKTVETRLLDGWSMIFLGEEREHELLFGQFAEMIGSHRSQTIRY